MKKRNNYLYPAAALLLVMLAAGCTTDDGFLPSPGEAPATSASPLTITVTDGAYTPADDDAAPATRAVERGYATEFTAGDKIGLYEVKQEAVSGGFSYYYKVTTKNSNLCLTYDGTAWTLPPGAELSPERPSANERTYYYAYYPWQDDSYMNGIVDYGRNWNSAAGIPPTPQEVFSNLILFWNPANDQSTYAAYTASDLMVSLGTVAPRTDGTDGTALHFEMEHQMALAVIRVPSTECTYTETISGSGTEKSYRLYTGMSLDGCWQENSHTARYLVPPQSNSLSNIGTYYTAGFEKRDFTVKIFRTSLTSGTYRLYTIDGGAETIKERPLHVGDFYMRDGSILPQKAAANGPLPTDVQTDCLGVVFWVGENEGKHWAQTKQLYGDHLLMRHHPECTRGMAVALRDASPTAAAWATGEGASEELYEWAKDFGGFTPAEQADWEEIQKSDLYFGYCGSRLMALYGSRHSDTTFPVCNAIADYAATHPAPAGSSGWFLPGRYELATLCFGAPINFGETNSPCYFKQLKMLKEINPQIDKAAGNELIGKYWSSDEWSTNIWYVNLASPSYGVKPKSDTYRVRAVIAF